MLLYSLPKFDMLFTGLDAVLRKVEKRTNKAMAIVDRLNKCYSERIYLTQRPLYQRFYEMAGNWLNVEDYRGAVIANGHESTFIIGKVCFPRMRGTLQCTHTAWAIKYPVCPPSLVHVGFFKASTSAMCHRELWHHHSHQILWQPWKRSFSLSKSSCHVYSKAVPWMEDGIRCLEVGWGREGGSWQGGCSCDPNPISIMLNSQEEEAFLQIDPCCLLSRTMSRAS